MNAAVATPVTRDALLAQMRQIVGGSHVLTDEQATRRFRKGHRTGEGNVLAVVRPGSLLEQWRILQAAVAADRIVIMQAANTGLTGGSTPDGADYDREIVLISTLRITGVQLINDGEQVVCLPGATLDRLEQALATDDTGALQVQVVPALQALPPVAFGDDHAQTGIGLERGVDARGSATLYQTLQQFLPPLIAVGTMAGAFRMQLQDHIVLSLQQFSHFKERQDVAAVVGENPDVGREADAFETCLHVFALGMTRGDHDTPNEATGRQSRQDLRQHLGIPGMDDDAGRLRRHGRW